MRRSYNLEIASLQSECRRLRDILAALLADKPSLAAQLLAGALPKAEDAAGAGAASKARGSRLVDADAAAEAAAANPKKAIVPPAPPAPASEPSSR